MLGYSSPARFLLQRAVGRLRAMRPRPPCSAVSAPRWFRRRRSPLAMPGRHNSPSGSVDAAYDEREGAEVLKIAKTDRAQATEDQLRQAEDGAVGTLAGGIAHRQSPDRDSGYSRSDGAGHGQFTIEQFVEQTFTLPIALQPHAPTPGLQPSPDAAAPDGAQSPIGNVKDVATASASALPSTFTPLDLGTVKADPASSNTS